MKLKENFDEKKRISDNSQPVAKMRDKAAIVLLPKMSQEKHAKSRGSIAPWVNYVQSRCIMYTYKVTKSVLVDLLYFSPLQHSFDQL